MALVLVAPLLGTASTSGDPARPGCEPAEPAGISARIVSFESSGAAAAVVVEYSITSTVELGRADVHASLRRLSGATVREVDLPSPIVHRGYHNTFRQTFTMEDGRDHGLLLTLRAEPTGRAPLAISTWLPIPLDPARWPREAGGVIEYRAQSGGGEEP